MAEHTGFFTDSRQSQYMATSRFAMVKKQDVNGLALVPLGIISQKPMANDPPLIKDFIGGVSLGCGNV